METRADLDSIITLLKTVKQTEIEWETIEFDSPNLMFSKDNVAFSVKPDPNSNLVLMMVTVPAGTEQHLCSLDLLPEWICAFYNFKASIIRLEKFELARKDEQPKRKCVYRPPGAGYDGVLQE